MLDEVADRFGGLAGMGLWITQIAKAKRIVPPPPMLVHCEARRDLSTTVSFGQRTLDLWRPEDPVKAPVLLFIPGGGWVLQSRRPQGYALMSHLVSQGWICVSIDYRTSPRHRWPLHFIDVQEALHWVRTNIADYGGDAEFVAVAGASAGGHMASLLGLAWDTPLGMGLNPPDAVISLYGSYDWVDRGSLWREVFVRFLHTIVKGEREAFHLGSPLHHVRADAPPFCVVHGAKDRLISVQEARDFSHSLKSVSQQRVDYIEVLGGHAFDLVSARQTQIAVEGISEFLDYAHCIAGLKRACHDARIANL